MRAVANVIALAAAASVSVKRFIISHGPLDRLESGQSSCRADTPPLACAYTRKSCRACHVRLARYVTARQPFVIIALSAGAADDPGSDPGAPLSGARAGAGCGKSKRKPTRASRSVTGSVASKKPTSIAPASIPEKVSASDAARASAGSAPEAAPTNASRVRAFAVVICAGHQIGHLRQPRRRRKLGVDGRDQAYPATRWAAETSASRASTSSGP